MKQNLKLEKDIYGIKGALEKLDEEFKEFIITQPNPKEFFELYHKFFYNIDRIIHEYFLRKSTEYAYPNGYVNPRTIDIKDLKSQIAQLKKDIENEEKHHFYFKNGKIIMEEEYSEDPTPELLTGNGNVYYLQSARKRPIKDYQTYLNLKMRVRKSLGEIDDKDFIIFVDKDCLSGLALGPDINTLNDIYIPLRNINIYPRNPNEGSTEEDGSVIDLSLTVG